MAIKFVKDIENEEGDVIAKAEMEVQNNETQIAAMVADGWKQVRAPKTTKEK